MITRLQFLFLSLLFVLGLGCGGGTATMAEVAAATQGKKLAVVSVSVNDFNGSLQGWNSGRTDDLLTMKMNEMLGVAEARFGQRWTVVPAASFVDGDAYQSQAGPDREVAVPRPAAKPMRLFGADRNELVKTVMPASKASALATAAGADLVAVIYSEWTVATGSFSPTSKPLAKTVVSIYDATGVELYHGRDDELGDRTLGAFGRVVVDEDTVNDWILAFDRALTNLLSQA